MISRFAPLLPSGEQYLQIRNMVFPDWMGWIYLGIEVCFISTAVIALVCLARSQTGDHFERHPQVTADDPRIWDTKAFKQT